MVDIVSYLCNSMPMITPEIGEEPFENFPSAEAYAVFGIERMAEIIGNEASLATTQELLDVVRTLCVDKYRQNHAGTYRWTLEHGRSPQDWLQLKFNPKGVTIVAHNEAQKGLVSLTNFRPGIKLPRSRDLPLFTRTYYHENLFVDQDGIAKVEGIVKTYKGNDLFRKQYAIKLATEDEVQSGLDMMTDAVFSYLTEGLVA